MSNVISLNKGNVINLSKANGNEHPKRLHIGCGWDMNDNVDADLDVFVVQLTKENKLIDKVYFGHKKSNDAAIVHLGDNLTGEGEGDDEVVLIDLDRLNPETHRLVIAVNIYQCRLSFDDVQNAFIRLLNRDTNNEMVRYNLSNKFGGSYAMILGEILNNEDGTWNFEAVGEGTDDRCIDDVVKRVSSGKHETNYYDAINKSQPAPQNQEKKKKWFGLFG